MYIEILTLKKNLEAVKKFMTCHDYLVMYCIHVVLIHDYDRKIFGAKENADFILMKIIKSVVNFQYGGTLDINQGPSVNHMDT